MAVCLCHVSVALNDVPSHSASPALYQLLPLPLSLPGPFINLDFDPPTGHVSNSHSPPKVSFIIFTQPLRSASPAYVHKLLPLPLSLPGPFITGLDFDPPPGHVSNSHSPPKVSFIIFTQPLRSASPALYQLLPLPLSLPGDFYWI